MIEKNDKEIEEIQEKEETNNEENFEFNLSKTKKEEFNDITNKYEEKLNKNKNSFLKIIDLVENKFEETLKIRNDIIDNTIPKVKQLYNDLSSDINIEDFKPINKKNKDVLYQNIEIKEPIKPNYSSGLFISTFLGIFFALAILGIGVLNIAKEMQITIPMDKLMNPEDAIKITEYIGLGFLGKEGDSLIGLGILAILFIIISSTIFIIKRKMSQNKSLKNANKFKKEVEEYIETLKNEQKDLSIYLNTLNMLSKEFKVFKVFIEELVAKGRRISTIKNININSNDKELKDTIHKLSKMIDELSRIQNLNTFNDSIKDIKEEKEKIINTISFINNEIYSLYEDKKYMI